MSKEERKAKKPAAVCRFKLTVGAETCKIEKEIKNGGMAMATRNKDELVQCKYCGEMYSTTYKHCPFCNEDGTGKWDDPDSEDDVRPAGGKRLLGGRGPGGGWSLGSIVGGIVSLILIIAAICIVVSIVKPLLGGGDPKSTPTPSAPSASQPVESQPAESDPAESVEPTPTVEPSAEPTPDASVPTDFTLNSTDFTFFSAGESFNMKVTFTPSGAQAPVVWSSSNNSVATISETGRVVAVGKGTCTVKATVEGVGEKTCIVRCNFKDTTASTPASTSTPDTTSSSEIKISSTDFTLFSPGETATLRISGTTEAVTWSSSNTDIATVDTSGKVTAVGKGTCTVTATVDGQTFKCIVRCNFKSE